MRRRSLRLLRPNPILNSDGDTGEFFRVKNYRTLIPQHFDLTLFISS